MASQPAPTVTIKAEPPVRLSRLLLGLLLVVVAFDGCFWKINALGFSLAVFVSALAVIILANREPLGPKRENWLLPILLAGALLATVMETGTTNVMVLLILIIAWSGQTFYRDTDSFWGRWLSQVVTWVFAPGRVIWLGARLAEAFFQKGAGSVVALIGLCLLTIPALILTLIFGSLLASGNAVFGSWTHSFFDWLWTELGFYLDLGRIVLWLIVAFMALPLLRPGRISERWGKATGPLTRLPEIIPTRAALFSSGLILIVLNFLFLVANTADALFLWSGAKLPSGVTFSGFVHNGVNSLIFTVILSAFVLTSIFQQALNVAGKRELKWLGCLWIAQNLFLLLSVILRLKLYIEAYDMTVSRLSLIIFLILVATGYGLLAIKIMTEKSLSWLIGGCAFAVFATFYVTQFLDLGGMSANYNEARWEKDRSKNLDLGYIARLGPAGWPALRRAADLGAQWEGPISPQQEITVLEGSQIEARFDLKCWREFSLRAWLNRWALDEKPNN